LNEEIYTQTMAAKNKSTLSHTRHSTSNTIHKLPSLTIFFQQSWELFKKTWTLYLKLVGLAIAYLFLALLIGILISLPITFDTVVSYVQLFNHLTPFQIADLVLMVAWMILFFLSLIAMSVIFPIVSIFILEGKKDLPLFMLVKQSKKYFWITLLAMLLCGYFVIGGLSLFVLPGIIISILFSFTTYEIVLGQQTVQHALKRSYLMVKNNFWAVVGRVLLVEIGAQIILNIFKRIAPGDVLFVIVYVLLSLLLGWYIQSYLFLLYKQIHKTVDFSRPVSLRWVWIVSSIGWVVLILIGISVITFLSNMHIPSTRPTLSRHPHHRLPNGAV